MSKTRCGDAAGLSGHGVWFLAIALGIGIPGPAWACIQGPSHQFLFAGTATEVSEPLVTIEGIVVTAEEDELTLKLTKPVKGIPVGTEVTILHTGSQCRNAWGAVEGTVFAIGGFRSFRLPRPVFEAVPLKTPLPPHSDIRKYVVDPDYLRKLKGEPPSD